MPTPDPGRKSERRDLAIAVVAIIVLVSVPVTWTAYCSKEVQVTRGGEVTWKDIDNYGPTCWELGFGDGTSKCVHWSEWNTTQIGDTFTWQETEKVCRW